MITQVFQRSLAHVVTRRHNSGSCKVDFCLISRLIADFKPDDSSGLNCSIAGINRTGFTGRRDLSSQDPLNIEATNDAVLVDCLLATSVWLHGFGKINIMLLVRQTLAKTG
jgi:hypothetical protein